MERMEGQLRSELEEILAEETKQNKTSISQSQSAEIISSINREVDEFNLLNNEKLSESQVMSSETYLTH